MRIDKKVAVKNTKLKGLGVFSMVPFKKGDVAICGKPTIISTARTDHSFQIDFDKHVELDEPARLVNHSCDPNLGLKNNKHGGYDFIAIKNINPGEELGWDYCTTEFISIAIKNECLCENQNCRVKIKGYVALPERIKKKYNGLIANYLKNLNQRGN